MKNGIVLKMKILKNEKEDNNISLLKVRICYVFSCASTVYGTGGYTLKNCEFYGYQPTRLQPQKWIFGGVDTVLSSNLTSDQL